MTEPKFSVGEVAIINMPQSPEHGKECEIISGLEPTMLAGIGFAFAHDVSINGRTRGGMFGLTLAYRPCNLRKKPKPDQPADADWQEDFKRMLNRSAKVTP